MIITVITNKSKNKDNNSEKIIKKGEEGGKKHKNTPKTDQDAPNTRHSKTLTTCNGTRIHYNNNR